MAVPTTIDNLNVVASSNSPSGSDSVTTSTGPDEYFRALSGIIRRGQASSTLASAGSLNLGGVVAGDYIDITGTTTITSFGTIAAGIERTLIFSGALTLTHNSTSLILPTGANITTVAGDVFTFRSEGSGNWRCTGRSASTPLTGHVTTSPSGAAVLGAFSSSQLSGALSDESGSGLAVFNTSPVLVTPSLGTPSSGNLSNCSNFPTLNQNTTGTAAGLSATLAIGSGGTGQTTALIPSGTKMLFVQASAPVGWTQVTSDNDKALRVVSGTGGGTGGSVAFETAFASQTVAGTNAGTSLSVAQLPSHTHANGADEGVAGLQGGNQGKVGNSGGGTLTGATGSGSTHTHTFTGGAIDLDVAYINTIICSKD